jgi:hypothetical protein
LSQKQLTGIVLCGAPYEVIPTSVWNEQLLD